MSHDETPGEKPGEAAGETPELSRLDLVEDLERKALRRRPRWLTRNVWTLSWVSFLQDAAGEMLYPLLPILLNTVLGAPAIVVGLVESMAEGAAAAMKLASAHLNKYMPRKVMVFFGYAAATLGKVIIALAGVWPIVLVGRVVDRLGKGLRSAPRDAILFVGSDKRDRGKVIGFHRTADTLGAVVGPALALGLLAIFDGDVRAVLWIAVIPGVIATLMVLLVRDAEPRGKTKAKRKAAWDARKVAAREDIAEAEVNPMHVPNTEIVPRRQRFGGKLPRSLDRLIIVLSIFAVVNFPDALLLLHLTQEGWSAGAVVGAYLLFNVSYALLSFPAGYLTDRMHPAHIYAIGLLCFVIAYGGLAFTGDHVISLLLIVIYGGFAAANDTVGKSWAAKLAPEKLQLVAQARLQGFAGFGILIAGLWAGATWMLGPGLGTIPLLVSSAVGLITAVFVLVVGPRLKAA